MRSSSDPAVLRRQRLGVAGVAVAALAAIALLGAWAGDLWETGHAAGPANPAGDGDVGFVPSLDGPVITEVMSSNGSTLADEDGDHPDWVELHNPSGEPVDLAGYFLSDDDEEPDRWQLPSVTLEPGGFLVVFASGKDRDVPLGELHTDFRIAQGDEPVLLVAPDGETVVDRLPGEDVPRDASIGRDPEDLRRVCLFAEPTPGGPNAPACFDDVELGAPTLSHSSGFYDEPFELEISVDHPDATVIYTLDGSFPDLEANPDRTFRYGGPLAIEDRTSEPNVLAGIDTTVPSDQVDWNVPDSPEVAHQVQKATVIRARSAYGAETTASYFVGEHLRRADLPVFSLTVDPDFLFDHDHGIYVAGRTYQEYRDSEDFDPGRGWRTPANYHERSRDWERPPPDRPGERAILELCPTADSCTERFGAGLRIHGNHSRIYPQKSLRLYARADYGNRTFDADVFGSQAPSGHRRLLLRNSGQDSQHLMFMDGYLQSLMRDFEAETQAYQPAVLFINGEYWGIHNLRERYDRHYLETVHGVDPDTVVQLGRRLEVDAGPPDADETFQEFLDYLATTDHEGATFLEMVETVIDVDSFFDLVIAHSFIGNWDWPGNNVRLWRDPDAPDALGEGVRDGRWRWMIFDLDHLGERVGRWNLDYNVFEERLAPTDDVGFDDGYPMMFHRLMEEPALQQRFLARYLDRLDGPLHPSRTLPRIDELEVLLAEEMRHHSARWSTPGSMEDWHADVERLRDFMDQRPAIQVEHLTERFGQDALPDREPSNQGS